MPTDTEVIAIFVVIFCGYYVFLRIARRNKMPWRFKSFFLGGGNLGTDLTENNTIGITFAWSGGTWYFAWLAYQYGPWVLISQIFWCFSIIVLALLLPRIIRNVKNKTIHGFLRAHYGAPAQIAAAGATTTGYFINAGFELFWSSLLFSRALGRPDLSLPVALLLALLVGTYCTIGGYKTNATIDKAQNIMGVAALAGLTWLIARQLHTAGSYELAVNIFAIGAALYISVSLLMYNPRLRRFMHLQNVLSVFFFLSSFIIVFVVLRETSGSSAVIRHITHNSDVPLWIVVNTVTFQIVFNIIDMQNWQEIAANGDADPSSFSSLSWAIVRGALYLMWFPALGGILLGSGLRAVGLDVNDGNLFTHAFGLVLPGAASLWRGLVMGLLLLGFIATSLSTVGDLIMSALQTICFDMLWPNRVERLVASPDTLEEQGLLSVARALVIPVAVSMVLAFYVLWRLYPGPVFNFQAVMYAAPLALLTPVLYGLFFPASASRGKRAAAFLSIFCSLVAIVVMFWLTTRAGTSDTKVTWLVTLMPLVANIGSLTIFAIVAVVTSMTPSRARKKGAAL